jgi:hypothetical protein
MDPWAYAATALLATQAQRPYQEASENALALQRRQFDIMEPYVRRQMARRETMFEPVENEALGRMGQRMQTNPWYASAWLGQARNLRDPMTLNY